MCEGTDLVLNTLLGPSNISYKSFKNDHRNFDSVNEH
jgi:hypothetical protein